jgi:hypothetical protein
MTEPEARRTPDLAPASLESPAAAPAPPAEDVSPPPSPRRDTSVEPPPSPRKPHDVLAWFCGVGFLILAGAIGFVWWSSQQLQSQPLADLQGLQDRVTRLEQRPMPQQGAPVDLGPLSGRVTALEQRTAPDLAPLEARIATLEKKVTDNSPFAARLDALSGRVDALSGRDQGAVTDLGRRLDADEARLAALERATAQMAAAAQQTARLARIEAAGAALAAGQPLGDLPNAPPAVAHFASANPPTEASLRLSYPLAERAALAASSTDTSDKPLFARLLARTGMIVRQGDRVVIGDDAAGVLTRARLGLDAGDLAGAVAAVSSLSGPPAAAMAGWLADAKALLQARAGLADMAAHA